MAESLLNRIIRHIEMSGPLPLAEYMHWCMSDRQSGYYQTGKPIGQKGDFVTAPEVSQMFGELIGIWALNAWHELGCPKPFNLVELGPGNGTLMKDMLRATSISEAFANAVNVQMIEISGTLANIQSQVLGNAAKVEWHTEIDKVPDQPSIIIANEFLDVLPFRQYVKSGGKWHENCVGFDDTRNLSWVLGAGVLDTQDLPQEHINEPDGAVFEVSNTRETFVTNIAKIIRKNTGVALFIDYGHMKSGFGDTFQAIREHSFADPLSEPGKCDLTSHVDFDALKRAVTGKELEVYPVMTQGEFLLSMGLLQRAGELGKGKDAATQERLKLEAERLALPDKMGNLFKVFAFSTIPDLPPFAKQG
ncbi:MAG: SAM-dependent methyltransferase [Pseudomonadota bacterium]